MLLHLSVDETGDLSLVEAEDAPDFLFRRVTQQMSRNLLRQVVEQIRMSIVGNVVEVDQSAGDVVLQTLLVDISAAEPDPIDLSSTQMRRPECLIGRLISHAGEIERERTKAGFHLSFGHHEDMGDVDRLWSIVS